MLPDHESILALIQKGAGFLSGPWRRQVFHAVFHYLHGFGHLAQDRNHFLGQALVAPHSGVVAKQDPFRSEGRRDSCDDVRARGLEPRRQQLRDDPRPVSVDDERWQAVAFRMYDTPCSCADAVTPPRGGGDPLVPPVGIDGPVAAREEPEADFRLRRIERLAEVFAFAIGDGNDAGRLVRLFRDIAAVNPRMTLVPPFSTTRSNADGRTV